MLNLYNKGAMPSCPHCRRRFRSKAAFELFEKRQAVLSDLKAYADLKKNPDRRTRHQADRQEAGYLAR